MTVNRLDARMDRPPIVLISLDRDRVSALLETACKIEPAILRFLREELERATVFCGAVAATSLVRMGSKVKFVEASSTRIQRGKLVYPEEIVQPDSISVLSSVGSALIGLGPGQCIDWTEDEVHRRLTVLEVDHPGERSP